MSPEVAGVVGAIAGALLGGPVGYLFERFLSRPRISVNYAEVAYEDVVSLPPEITRNIGRHPLFLGFVESQVKWQFLQRVHANLFTKEELRVVLDLGTHFLEYQAALMVQLDRDKSALQAGDPTDIQRLSFEVGGDYQQAYGSILAFDLATDKAAAIEKLESLLSAMRNNIESGSKWLSDFLNATEMGLRMDKGTSERLIVRAGLGNQGLQGGVIDTETRLKFGNKEFRLPIQVASRPWESDESGPSKYFVLEPKSFLVLDFLIDERVNAPKDVEELRKALKRGAPVKFLVLEIGGRVAAERAFEGAIPA